MWFSVGECGANADDEDGAVALGIFSFALLRCEVGVFGLHIFGVQEGDLFGQARCDVWKAFIHFLFGFFDGAVDVAHGGFECFQIAVAFANHFFPVPLVYVE